MILSKQVAHAYNIWVPAMDTLFIIQDDYKSYSNF